MSKKSRIEIFNDAANAIKNLTILTLGLSIIAFFIFPSFEVFVKDKLLHQDYCFYVGAWDSSSKKFTEVLYDLKEADYDEESGQIKVGNVLLATTTEIIGRTDFGTNAGLRKYVGKSGDCILVLESRGLNIPGNENKSAIWVRALPNVCK